MLLLLYYLLLGEHLILLLGEYLILLLLLIHLISLLLLALLAIFLAPWWVVVPHIVIVVVRASPHPILPVLHVPCQVVPPTLLILLEQGREWQQVVHEHLEWLRLHKLHKRQQPTAL